MADDERDAIDAARARTGYKGPIPGAGEALHHAQRHGDFSGIVLRRELGIPLSSEEQAALEALDRGDKLRTGRKDPATAFESVVCWRWLVERAGWSGPDAHSLLGEMMGVTPAAIRERIKRAKGLGRNIADLTFDVHAQRDITPALLRHRTAKGHCLKCRKVRCRCDPAPRPAFEDTPEGAQVAVLLSFWRLDRASS
ncbi:hypothetical protein MR829_08710 [Paracoccus versutus]|uniref:hypothetical protein n=1 Tax=Paracoccus versutus TaxID=34007 RepID=UPI001FB7D6D6|nr:hypothetical protein [Paracoccus versutus]MCJ1900457.1 hypothetical protein [Paracoccus versutus]